MNEEFGIGSGCCRDLGFNSCFLMPQETQVMYQEWQKLAALNISNCFWRV
jgi:hypothetical protein